MRNKCLLCDGDLKVDKSGFIARCKKCDRRYQRIGLMSCTGPVGNSRWVLVPQPKSDYENALDELNETNPGAQN